ncbi:unnamed protein product [Ambrosiozyma monospora]|uniref:Unnamed protein product n=1 Tax=Ambrosiozyma monospora TaxID=43982 RepID=A0ACB5TJI1_AMBMO|nr:unnamed protein product [Ambrosiozyma monospora]
MTKALPPVKSTEDMNSPQAYNNVLLSASGTVKRTVSSNTTASRNTNDAASMISSVKRTTMKKAIDKINNNTIYEEDTDSQLASIEYLVPMLNNISTMNNINKINSNNPFAIDSTSMASPNRRSIESYSHLPVLNPPPPVAKTNSKSIESSNISTSDHSMEQNLPKRPSKESYSQPPQLQTTSNSSIEGDNPGPAAPVRHISKMKRPGVGGGINVPPSFSVNGSAVSLNSANAARSLNSPIKSSYAVNTVGSINTEETRLVPQNASGVAGSSRNSSLRVTPNISHVLKQERDSSLPPVPSSESSVPPYQRPDKLRDESSLPNSQVIPLLTDVHDAPSIKDEPTLKRERSVVFPFNEAGSRSGSLRRRFSVAHRSMKKFNPTPPVPMIAEGAKESSETISPTHSIKIPETVDVMSLSEVSSLKRNNATKRKEGWLTSFFKTLKRVFSRRWRHLKPKSKRSRSMRLKKKKKNQKNLVISAPFNVRHLSEASPSMKEFINQNGNVPFPPQLSIHYPNQRTLAPPRSRLSSRGSILRMDPARGLELIETQRKKSDTDPLVTIKRTKSQAQIERDKLTQMQTLKKTQKERALVRNIWRQSDPYC